MPRWEKNLFDGADLVSAGYNIIGDESCGSLLASDQTETDPMLNMSPAINGGNPDGCLDHENVPILRDQRGQSCPVDGRCDVGALKFRDLLFFSRFESGS